MGLRAFVPSCVRASDRRAYRSRRLRPITHSVFRAFGISDKGRIRPANEDCFAIHEDLGLLVVADGMGGHNAGEVAARMAVDAVVDFFTALHNDCPFGLDPALSPEGNRIRTAILLANARVLESAVTVDAHAGMGTTIVAARIADGRLSVGHVGDSRLYLLSGGRFRQLTLDDSWAATMLAHDPLVDRALLHHHPLRHALTNVVGTRARTDVHVTECGVSSGDVVLVTTDGVHDVLDDPRLEQLLRRSQDAEALAREIVGRALAGGSRDNLTAVVGLVASQPTNL